MDMCSDYIIRNNFEFRLWFGEIDLEGQIILVGILHIICRGYGSNRRHPTSTHLKCMNSNH